MRKKSYVKPCIEVVHVVAENPLLANSVGFGDEHDDITEGMPGGVYNPEDGGGTGVVYDPTNQNGTTESKGYNVWDSHL